MTETTRPLLVELTREIEASPATVWSILTTPEGFSAWMEGSVSFERRPGSPFRAEFPNFHTVISGEIVTLDDGARHLGVTWGIESGPQAESFPAGCSLVEFRVHEADVGCRVELTHSRLPSEESARQQEHGWSFQLSRMSLRANRADLGEALQRTLAGWFEAWNETDDTRRLEMLRSCCADDIEFRDDWAVANGVDLLSVHIGNCFRYMPGWSIEATGDVRICRGEALVGWRSKGPDGASQEGFNHVRAGYDGTISRVSGFAAPT